MPEKTPNKSIVNTLLVVALIIAAGAIGHLYTKAQYLEGNLGQASGKAVNAPDAAPPAALGSADDVEPVTDTDLIRGNKNAEIVLIEYSDLECPFCSRFHPTAKQVLEEYGDKMAWVYRHYPLTQIHPKAQKLAEVVECVKNQKGNDTAWKLMDAIFEDQTITVKDAITKAGTFGADTGKVNTCVDNGDTADYIGKQLSSATAVGVTGTPGNILLNTKTGKTAVIPGAVPYEQVKAAIDSLL